MGKYHEKSRKEAQKQSGAWKCDYRLRKKLLVPQVLKQKIPQMRDFLF